MNKIHLRDELKKLRSQLSEERRKEARSALLALLLPSLVEFENILSFSSFGHEIDTSLLNLFLARTQRLLLPRMDGETLRIYRVIDPFSQVIAHECGLLEPDPKQCDEVDLQTIQIILVPALGFDQNNHRLGYGKGFYDRFLKQLSPIKTIGVGFKEQLVKKLPTEPTDFPLEKVSLF